MSLDVDNSYGQKLRGQLRFACLFTEYAIRIKNSTFTWKDEADDNPTLQNIYMEVKHGELLAVVGSVGSGKTSLISALLGDMLKLQGTAAVSVSCFSVHQNSFHQLSQ